MKMTVGKLSCYKEKIVNERKPRWLYGRKT